mmetsp:Transcript_7492/g.6806  ORF Transcript_7492/g.6806 Transcript_7492/m.6806 type:complete len:89 (+) Transcript_7492:2188-2454(+)
MSALSEIIYKKLNFYSLDSLYAVERKAYSRQEAFEIGLAKTFEDRGINYEESDSFWQANTYPCNSGLVVEVKEEEVALGFSYQHGLMC